MKFSAEPPEKVEEEKLGTVDGMFPKSFRLISHIHLVKGL